MKLPGNMQGMMKQAQQMQAAHAGRDRADHASKRTAGGGMVTVKMDGQKSVLGVKIDPKPPATPRCCRTW